MSFISQRLKGKIAVVTASTDGIGFAIAQRLAQEGAKVIISSRKERNVTEAVNKLRNEGLDVEGLICHVSKSEDRQKLFEQAGKHGVLDILVSNAAVNPEVGDVLEYSEESWDKIFDVNVKSSFLLAKEALPLLRQSKAGRIVFISSLSAFRPFSLLGVYSVSKTALLGLTKAAALQLAPEGITVNSVAPGVIKTKFSEAITSTEDSQREALALIPLNRLGTPYDVSGVVAFLVSDDAGYVTGENIVVSGGMTSRL